MKQDQLSAMEAGHWLRAAGITAAMALAWIIHEAGRREGRGRFSSSAFHSRRSPCREGS